MISLFASVEGVGIGDWNARPLGRPEHDPTGCVSSACLVDKQECGLVLAGVWFGEDHKLADAFAAEGARFTIGNDGQQAIDFSTLALVITEKTTAHTAAEVCCVARA